MLAPLVPYPAGTWLVGTGNGAAGLWLVNIIATVTWSVGTGAAGLWLVNIIATGTWLDGTGAAGLWLLNIIATGMYWRCWSLVGQYYGYW